MSCRWIVAAAALLLVAGSAEADTLVVCTEASPDTLSSALSSANTSFDVAEQYADRLVEMEIGGSKLIPALAKSWEVSEDGLRYTFRLRTGVKFQSNAAFRPGREFNADDVVFSFNRMLDKTHRFNKVGGGNYPLFAALVEPGLKSVGKTDDMTVVFEVKTPQAPLLSALSVQPFSIASAEYAAMDKAGTPDQLDLNPLGTGPFQLVQYSKDSSVRFRAFADFWGKAGGMPERAAKVDNLVFSITPDAAVRLAKLRANECQVVRYPNPADVEAMKAATGVRVLESTIASVSYMAFKVDKKPFDDRRVREALAVSIDLDSLVRAVYQGTGTPTAALVSAALWGHNDRLRPRQYDPARARALLAEAGMAGGVCDRFVGHSGGARLHAQRPARGGDDPGGLGQDRRDSQDRDLRMGRVLAPGSGRRGRCDDAGRHLGLSRPQPDGTGLHLRADRHRAQSRSLV